MALPFHQYNFIGNRFAIGGLNQKAAVTNVGDNETPECKNVIFDNTGSVTKRKGFAKLNSTQIAGAPTVTGIFQLQRSDGAECVIIGAGTDIYESATTPVSILSGQTDGALYDFAALNDYAFIVNGVDDNKKFDCSTITDLGIEAAPSGTVATEVNLGGGVLANGTYQYVITFVNSDGDEGNPSPASSVTVAAGPSDVDLSSIPVSADPQVTDRNIYRTNTGGAIFFFVGSVGDNVTTTFSDTVPNSGLGAEVEFDNDKPPVLKYIEEHKGFLFGVEAANPSRVRFSKQFRHSSWPTLNFIDVSPDDGDELTGLTSFFDQLLPFKREAIYIISGATDIDFTLQRAQTETRTGSISTRSAVVVGNLVIFLSERGVYGFDGLRTHYLSEKIETIWDNTNPNQSRTFNWAQEGRVVAASYKSKSRSWYWLTIPTGSSLENDLTLVYDDTLKAWTFFEGIFANSLAIVEESNEPFLYSGDYNGFLWKQDTTDNDGFVHFPSFSTSNSNTATTLEDTTQAFTVDELVGVRVKIIDGLGEDQVRTITSNTATVITVGVPWSTIPDTTSEYSIGFIDAQWESRWFHYNSPENSKRLRYMYVNINREGNYDVDVGVRFDFFGGDTNTFTQSLALSGADSIWDTSLWDVDEWDQVSQVVSRLSITCGNIHRYVQIEFKNDAGDQPFVINSFDLVYQLKGLRS